MKRILVSVGEPSGDLLASEWLQHMRKLEPSWEFFGIGGPRLRALGFNSVASMEHLEVMGFVEVAKALPRIIEIEQKLINAIERFKPDAALLVDYPGFHLHLAAQCQMRGIAVYQYVAPQVWAWAKGRIPKLRAYFNHIFGIMPFEEAFFKQHSIPYTYVGTPMLDRALSVEARTRKSTAESPKRLLAVFPGSRVSEVSRHVKFLVPSLSALKREWSDLEIVVSQAPGIKSDALESLCTIPGLSLSQAPSMELMAAADLCLVKSGTSTLECGLLGTPMVVFYQLHPLSYALARRLVKIPHVSLVNLLYGSEIVSEHLQSIEPEKLLRELSDLLSKGPSYHKQKQALSELRSRLKGQPGLRLAEELQGFQKAP